MIQLNLLPDVKLEYIRAKRVKRAVVFLSTVVSGAALTLLVFMLLIVLVFQKHHIANLTNDIKSSTKKLQQVDNLDKILTVQSQLSSLTCTAQDLKENKKPCLHDKKPVTSRVFTFVEQITPTKVTIANLKLDFALQSLTIEGSADSLSTVNKYVDTIKFTGYQVGDDAEQKRPFSSIVLSSFGRDDKGASYVIALKFDPAIFDANKAVKLVVPPNKITTRSEVDKPDALFQPLNNSSVGQ